MIRVGLDTATRWWDVEVTLTDRQTAFDSSFSSSSEIHTRVDFFRGPVFLPPFFFLKARLLNMKLKRVRMEYIDGRRTAPNASGEQLPLPRDLTAVRDARRFHLLGLVHFFFQCVCLFLYRFLFYLRKPVSRRQMLRPRCRQKIEKVAEHLINAEWNLRSPPFSLRERERRSRPGCSRASVSNAFLLVTFAETASALGGPVGEGCPWQRLTDTPLCRRLQGWRRAGGLCGGCREPSSHPLTLRVPLKDAALRRSLDGLISKKCTSRAHELHQKNFKIKIKQ